MSNDIVEAANMALLTIKLIWRSEGQMSLMRPQIRMLLKSKLYQRL